MLKIIITTSRGEVYFRNDVFKLQRINELIWDINNKKKN